MTENSNFCEYCGSPLASGANFCESCGQQVKKVQGEQPAPVQSPPSPTPVPQQVVRPTPVPRSTQPPSYPPIPPLAPPKRRSVLPVILGLGGCGLFLCIGLIFVAGLLISRSRSTIDNVSQIVPEKPVIIPEEPEQDFSPTEFVESTEAPNPTDIEASEQVEVPAAVWSEAIGQQLTDTYFSDDFSTAAFEWASGQDDISFWGIEDGHYTLHLFEPDYTAWAYLPVNFNPTSIGFEALVQPGFDQGAYGVICYYQDEENYHFVSIDPLYKDYSIGYVVNDEYGTLLEDTWMSSAALNDSPYSVNTILVVCDPDMITLFINNELEAQAALSTWSSGEVALFGETWTDTPSEGFKVFFDNLTAFIPAQ